MCQQDTTLLLITTINLFDSTVYLLIIHLMAKYSMAVIAAIT
jgi:hypothetical protein